MANELKNFQLPKLIFITQNRFTKTCLAGKQTSVVAELSKTCQRTHRIMFDTSKKSLVLALAQLVLAKTETQQFQSTI
jgi:hypothetical protein